MTILLPRSPFNRASKNTHDTFKWTYFTSTVCLDQEFFTIIKLFAPCTTTHDMTKECMVSCQRFCECDGVMDTLVLPISSPSCPDEGFSGIHSWGVVPCQRVGWTNTTNTTYTKQDKCSLQHVFSPFTFLFLGVRGGSDYRHWCRESRNENHHGSWQPNHGIRSCHQFLEMMEKWNEWITRLELCFSCISRGVWPFINPPKKICRDHLKKRCMIPLVMLNSNHLAGWSLKLASTVATCLFPDLHC